MNSKKPIYKRKWFPYVVAVILLFAFIPSKDDAEESVVVESKQAETAEKAQEVSAKSAESSEKEVEEIAEIVPLTKDEVLSMVTIDPDMGPYENGTFILKDNTLIKADMYFFGEGSGYIDGTAIFSDGKLARLKLTLNDDSGIAEAFEQFGVYDVENIERPVKTAFAYEYTFNDVFARDNIHRYPYELD